MAELVGFLFTYSAIFAIGAAVITRFAVVRREIEPQPPPTPEQPTLPAARVVRW